MAVAARYRYLLAHGHSGILCSVPEVFIQCNQPYTVSLCSFYPFLLRSCVCTSFQKRPVIRPSTPTLKSCLSSRCRRSYANFSNVSLSTHLPPKEFEDPLPSVPDKGPHDHQADIPDVSMEYQGPVAFLPADSDSDTTQDVLFNTNLPSDLVSDKSLPSVLIQPSIPEVTVPSSAFPRNVLTNSLGKCSMEGNFHSSNKKITISSPIVLAVPWPTNSDVSLSTYQSSTSPCIRAHTAASRRSFPCVEDGMGKVVVYYCYINTFRLIVSLLKLEWLCLVGAKFIRTSTFLSRSNLSVTEGEGLGLGLGVVPLPYYMYHLQWNPS